MVIAAIGIGSNLDNPAENCKKAIELLGDLGKVRAVSKLYATKPWGILDQPDFCNAAALVDTALGPRDLLKGLQQIETKIGRTATIKWGPRVIDLDILTYGDLQMDESDLKIPHPFMNERAFVLIPLADVLPEYQRLVDSLPTESRSAVTPL
jgi:2-amino-4-hydroxy-6-hydroxymethyldihydropteridine diphosphokinase